MKPVEHNDDLGAACRCEYCECQRIALEQRPTETMFDDIGEDE